MDHLDFKATRFYAQGHWFARAESPSAIATRLGRFIDCLASIDPLFSNPIVFGTTKTLYSSIRSDLASHVAKNVSRDQSGPFVREGYVVGARYERNRYPFVFSGTVGRDLSRGLNNLSFEMDYGNWPDLSVISYALYRSIVIALIECWEPTGCDARPNTLLPFVKPSTIFAEAWITYIPPDLVSHVEPDNVPILERMPDGGMLLSATKDLFDPARSDHIEAARRIAHAIRKVNDVLPPI